MIRLVAMAVHVDFSSISPVEISCSSSGEISVTSVPLVVASKVVRLDSVIFWAH